MTASPSIVDPDVLRQDGLRYVTDASPGISRRRCGSGFAYYDRSGAHITDQAVIVRIKALAVPPAWTEIWICPQANGHLQATGLDARGRKQYLYHPRWREVRDAAKYEGLLDFAALLPKIRAQIEEDMRLPGLPREKVLATVVRLLDTTLIRVGNDEYARNNDSYGLTTMRKKHVDLDGGGIRFRFTGKSGKQWNLAVTDRRVASVIRQCSELPGYELFKYEDDAGELVDVTSTEVNDYLREVTGTECTSKEFRTWAGTVLAAMALEEAGPFDTAREGQSQVARAIERVARRLGNTPAICRTCYVHPAVIDAYLEGDLVGKLGKGRSMNLVKNGKGFDPAEKRVLGILRKRLAPDRKPIASEKASVTP